jgi:hypothetical protein
MTKRGKVLRDTDSGLGLVTVDGQHFQFGLEGVGAEKARRFQAWLCRWTLRRTPALPV